MYRLQAYPSGPFSASEEFSPAPSSRPSCTKFLQQWIVNWSKKQFFLKYMYPLWVNRGETIENQSKNCSKMYQSFITCILPLIMFNTRNGCSSVMARPIAFKYFFWCSKLLNFCSLCKKEEIFYNLPQIHCSVHLTLTSME